MTNPSIASDLIERLAPVVHAGRFPADREPTPYEDEDLRGREYCERIAQAVAQSEALSQLTREVDELRTVLGELRPHFQFLASKPQFPTAAELLEMIDDVLSRSSGRVSDAAK